eukprot:1176642-Prorocentrum_minimum.AAC.2
MAYFRLRPQEAGPPSCPARGLVPCRPPRSGRSPSLLSVSRPVVQTPNLPSGTHKCCANNGKGAYEVQHPGDPLTSDSFVSRGLFQSSRERIGSDVYFLSCCYVTMPTIGPDMKPGSRSRKKYTSDPTRSPAKKIHIRSNSFTCIA